MRKTFLIIIKAITHVEIVSQKSCIRKLKSKSIRYAGNEQISLIY